MALATAVALSLVFACRCAPRALEKGRVAADPSPLGVSLQGEGGSFLDFAWMGHGGFLLAALQRAATASVGQSGRAEYLPAPRSAMPVWTASCQFPVKRPTNRRAPELLSRMANTKG